MSFYGFREFGEMMGGKRSNSSKNMTPGNKTTTSPTKASEKSAEKTSEKSANQQQSTKQRSATAGSVRKRQQEVKVKPAQNSSNGDSITQTKQNSISGASKVTVSEGVEDNHDHETPNNHHQQETEITDKMNNATIS